MPKGTPTVTRALAVQIAVALTKLQPRLEEHPQTLIELKDILLHENKITIGERALVGIVKELGINLALPRTKTKYGIAASRATIVATHLVQLMKDLGKEPPQDLLDVATNKPIIDK